MQHSMPLAVAFIVFAASRPYVHAAPRAEPSFPEEPKCSRIQEIRVYFGKRTAPSPGKMRRYYVAAKALMTTSIEEAESARLLAQTVEVRGANMSLAEYLNEGAFRAEDDLRYKEAFRGADFKKDRHFFMRRKHQRMILIDCEDGRFQELADGPLSSVVNVEKLRDAGARIVPIPNPN